MESKVSIVMPCYNAEKYIARAIESILQQTYANWELIIVDDASTDDSLRVINQYAQKDSRIGVYANEKNMGPGAARNLGISHCDGRYIALLDADDISKDRRLEKQVNFLDRHKEYGAVGGQAQVMDENDHIIDVIHAPLAWSDIKKCMFFRDPFINSSMMFRKCILDKHQLSFDEDLKMGEDYLFWIHMSQYCKMQILKDYLIFYRMNTTGLCYQWTAEMNSNPEGSSQHRKIFHDLWRQRGIDITQYDTECLINALTGKSVESIWEAYQNVKNVIRYGLNVCGYRYDQIVFQQMRKYIKVAYQSAENLYSCYKNQFQVMKNCVKKYGNYPYPKYMVIPEKKLIYLEMPKVANCSIKASMLKAEFQDDYSVQKESLKYTVHRLEGRYRNYYKFTFVRNPFDRLVSCYESKYHKDRMMIGNVVKELEYDHYLFGYIKKDRGFTNFLCRIFWIPDPYKDHHFKPQYKIVYEADGKKRVNYVGKYENLAQEYSEISSRYDLDKLAVYNKTERKSYMDYYNKYTARLAYLIYRKDVKCFGYEKEYHELLDYVDHKRHRNLKGTERRWDIRNLVRGNMHGKA